MNKIYVVLTFVSFVMFGYQQAIAQANQPPYESPVPKFTFPNTLTEQENELKANPLLKRFADSRKKQSADRYRPLYHFVSPESTLNDPNGLCFWKGNWHMFYQGYPPEDNEPLLGAIPFDNMPARVPYIKF